VIRYAVEGGIATVLIDRPEKRNALTYALLGDFLAAVKRAGEDAAARAVIVTGAGGAFCAGTDRADLATVPGPQRGLRGSPEQEERWWPLVACPKPVIAAVDGVAVGMGAEFTSQCDVRIASTRAPGRGRAGAAAARCRRRCRARARGASGRFVGAEEALALG
jgi:enoyl-CoA hydratase